MKLTTLCYLEKDNSYLMLHRTKKENDENKGKWIGVGGKLEAGESPEDALYREVLEETGLTLSSHRFRAIITFISDTFGEEMMFLFTSNDFTGEMITCTEGDLCWVPISKLNSLNLWEGDRIFLDILKSSDSFFSLKLQYKGDTLINASLNGDREAAGRQPNARHV